MTQDTMLREALEPFAKAAEWYDRQQNYLDSDVVVQHEKHQHGDVRLEVGDLRHAREVLASPPQAAEASVAEGQVFVVHNKAKQATYVFTNHDAALRCRQEQKLNHWALTGCAIFDDWKDGEPSGRR